MTYQGDDDLTVRVRLERVGLGKVLAQKTVVVDLTVDSENNRLILVGQWLGARVYQTIQ